MKAFVRLVLLISIPLSSAALWAGNTVSDYGAEARKVFETIRGGHFPPGSETSTESGTPIRKITLEEKKAIAGYVFSILEASFRGGDSPNLVKPPARSMDFAYEHVFVTLFSKGRLLGCQRGHTNPGTPGRLFSDLREATLRAIGDKRFVNNRTDLDTREITIVVNFLHDRREMEKNSLDFLKSSLVLGVHSVSVAVGERQAFFLSSVPITHGYSLKKLMARLCRKAHLPEDAYLDPRTKILRYETLVFKADRPDNVTDLIRYNTELKEEEITNPMIVRRLSMFQDWTLNNINPKTGIPEYIYYPSRDNCSSDFNPVRQIANLWVGTELARFLGSKAMESLHSRTFEHFLKALVVEGDTAYVGGNSRPSIGLNAFLMMALMNSNRPGKDELVAKLGRRILANQKSDGSYQPLFLSPDQRAIDFFPGEAMLALMKWYGNCHDPNILQSLKKAFPFYREYWRKNRKTAFVPWHAQADFLLFGETRDREVAEFVFEMCDWLIDEKQCIESTYPELIGGFPRFDPRFCSTASQLEGLGDAFALAERVGDKAHAEKYRAAIRRGIRFLLQGQFTPENSFFTVNPRRALGGMRSSLCDTQIRVDFNQHSAAALMKAVGNRVFPD